MSKPRFTPEVAALVYVAQSWSHEDDWSVPSIYIDTLEEIARALAAGDEAGALARHGKHTDRDCDRSACASRIPHTFEADRAMMERLGSPVGVSVDRTEFLADYIVTFTNGQQYRFSAESVDHALEQAEDAEPDLIVDNIVGFVPDPDEEYEG